MTVDWFLWTSYGLFALATIYVLMRMLPLGSLINDEDHPHVGRRTWRLVMRRGLWSMGWWQESVALILIASDQWALPTTVALILMGLYLMWGSRHLWAFGMMDA